jgi:hypothetical protein
VKCCRIEVGIVRPDESTNFWVEPDGIEGGKVLERPKQWTMQYRPKVDALLGAVGEPHDERVRAVDTKPRHAVNRMRHRVT